MLCILFLFFNVVVLISIIFIRYPATILPYVSPFPLDGTGLLFLWITFFATSTIYIIKKYRQLDWKLVIRTYFELSILSLIFFFLWLRIPFDKSNRFDLIFPFVLALMIIGLVFKTRRNNLFTGLRKKNFLSALTWLTLPTLVVVIVSLVWFISLDDAELNIQSFLELFLFYLVFAFCQLLFFLEFPLMRFRKLNHSNIEVIFVIAIFFGLIHWPNYTTVIGTFFLMVVWALIYLKYPNIWATALAFGISATFAIQLLPHNFFYAAKPGPGLVNERIKNTQPGRLFQRVNKKFKNEILTFKNGDVNTKQFSLKLYAMILQQEPIPVRIRLWENIRNVVGNESALLAFLISSEIKSAEWYHNGEQPEDHLNEYRGYLDEAFQTEEDMIRLRGWAANTTIDIIAKKLLVFVNGTLILEKEPNIFRPDLWDPLKNSGFQFDIQLDKPQPPKDNEIRIFALFKDNILAELQYPNQYQWLIK